MANRALDRYMDADERLKQKFSVLFLYPDERQRRIAAATEASCSSGRKPAVLLLAGKLSDQLAERIAKTGRR